jgi:hypothetical protein
MNKNKKGQKDIFRKEFVSFSLSLCVRACVCVCVGCADVDA